MIVYIKDDRIADVLKAHHDVTLKNTNSDLYHNDMFYRFIIYDREVGAII